MKHLLCARPEAELRRRQIEQEPGALPCLSPQKQGLRPGRVLLALETLLAPPPCRAILWAPGMPLLPRREPWEWEAASCWPGAQGGPGGRALGRVHFLAPLFAACPWRLVAVSAPPTASLDEWAAGPGLEFPTILSCSCLPAGCSPWSATELDECPAPSTGYVTSGRSLRQSGPLFPLLDKGLMD